MALNNYIRQITGKSGRAIVRTAPPHRIEAEYRIAIDKMIVDINREYRDNIAPLLKREIEIRDTEQRVDSITDILEMIDDLIDRVVPISSIVLKILKKVFDFNTKKFTSSIADKIGVAVHLPPGKTDEMMKSWNMANKSELDRLRRDHLQRFGAIVQRGWADGLSYQAIADQIVNQSGVSRNRAKFIARDQIGNLNGALTRERNEQLGVEEFKWRTMQDERVRGDPSGLYPKARPSHFKFADETYDWKTGSGVSRARFPGSDYLCRCYAESIIEW